MKEHFEPHVDESHFETCCQTPVLVLRLGVDFVLPLSKEQQQEEEEHPLTKIYQWGVN